MIEDCIWFAIYLGMATGFISVGIVVYGTYLEFKHRKEK